MASSGGEASCCRCLSGEPLLGPKDTTHHLLGSLTCQLPDVAQQEVVVVVDNTGCTSSASILPPIAAMAKMKGGFSSFTSDNVTTWTEERSVE